MTTPPPTHQQPALVVLSHLFWDFVWQRPQHLMTQAARSRRVLFVETPDFAAGVEPHLRRAESDGVTVCKPQIPSGHSAEDSQRMTAEALSDFVAAEGITSYDLWVYTPMELPVADQLTPRVVVYDCMDELSAFRFAPAELHQREAELLRRADVVFTGGQSLYEAKVSRHANVHAFPSSVDTAHFASAAGHTADPTDQADLPRPRLGYCGVIDERIDLDLVAALADARPQWQLVMVGPTAKLDPADLPHRPNIAWLGSKQYADLPAYLGHWDVGLMPFALNEATRYISPTKTPEYLAAGLPVVSTGIRDVIHDYGDDGLVRVADGADAFEQACAQALAERGTPADASRRERVQERLSTMSWAATWAAMSDHLEAAASSKGTHA